MGKISQYIEALKVWVNPFKKTAPITTSDAFGQFLATRSAFIAQKTLYGYVKTRMGMKYPTMFEDDVFMESLNIAKWRVYAACLGDLAIFMSAQVYNRTGNPKEAARIASTWFARIVAERFSDPDFTGDYNEIIDDFGNRVALVDWNHAIEREGAFKESPKALVRWAPIADELKVLDTEIVQNSIRFQWQRIRTDFLGAFDPEAFLSDWQMERS